MRRRVHPPRHPTQDHHPPQSARSRESFSAIPAPYGVKAAAFPPPQSPPAPANPHSRANPKHCRRIKNLPQPLRISLIIKRNPAAPHLRRVRFASSSAAARARPSAYKLRRSPRHPHPLQLRQPRLEHPLRIAPSRCIAFAQSVSAPSPESTPAPSTPAAPSPRPQQHATRSIPLARTSPKSHSQRFTSTARNASNPPLLLEPSSKNRG